jgi:MFS transporter, DHA2 family, multidrug resistance protein
MAAANRLRKNTPQPTIPPTPQGRIATRTQGSRNFQFLTTLPGLCSPARRCEWYASCIMASAATVSPQAAAPWRPKHNQWAIALTVTLATFMEVLDTSIANVSLPHIAGSLAASEDEATWVITSYLVANAIILPASAYLSNLIGRKRFYMTCVAIFAVSSLLCGLAPSLPLLLVFRIIQGAGGGGLAPSEQAILADTFEPSKRGQAFALYGLAVVFAPAIGPTLGGWITDNFSWRWIFFINVPVAILSLFLTHRIVEDPPHVKEEVAAAKSGNFRLDYFGFALVALAFGSLEVVLDKGQEDDWFNSRFITTFIVVTALSMTTLIAWELYQGQKKKRPILDLRLFANPTFAISFCMMFILGTALYGTTVLIPQFLQTLLGYTAARAGMALSGGGLVTMLCMPIVGKLVGKVDPRYLIFFGFAVTGIALMHMETISLGISFGYAAELRAFQAVGLAFLFVPINTISYTGIPPDKNNDVSGLTNLARNIGGSVGTAVVTTMLARGQQVHQVYLAANVTPGNPTLLSRMQGTAAGLVQHGVSTADSTHGAYARIYGDLQRQASVLSYIDILRIFAISALLIAPLVFFMKRPNRGGGAAMH